MGIFTLGTNHLIVYCMAREICAYYDVYDAEYLASNYWQHRKISPFLISIMEKRSRPRDCYQNEGNLRPLWSGLPFGYQCVGQKTPHQRTNGKSSQYTLQQRLRNEKYRRGCTIDKPLRQIATKLSGTVDGLAYITLKRGFVSILKSKRRIRPGCGARIPIREYV